MTVQASWNGKVIAESENTVVVEGNHYFPIEDVKGDLLEQSDAHSTCIWKGKASYYTLVVDGQRNVDAAWYYPRPSKVASRVANRVAFWHGVKITKVGDDDAPRGGWKFWQRASA